MVFDFLKKKKEPLIEIDKSKQYAVLKCSICNGEQVAGFKDINTGRFTEIMLVKTSTDLDKFMDMYNVTDISKEY